MNKIISILLIGLFIFSTNDLLAQQTAKIQMTPAEYQSLMETILKAKKKRMAKRNRFYYQQRLQQQNQQQNQQQASQNQNAATDQTASKIKELEKVYQQLTRQQQQSDRNNQQSDRNNQELEQVKTKLEQEMNQLQAQLRQEQVATVKDTIFQKNTNNNNYNDRQLKERNRILEEELLALRKQNNTLIVGQDRSERYIDNIKDKGNRRDEDLENTSSAISRLKRQVKELELNDKEVDQLKLQIKVLEKNQRNFALLSQANASKRITDANSPVDSTAYINAAYLDAFSKDIAEMEFKIEQLEAAPAPSNNNAPDEARLKALEDKINALSSTDITALQTKIIALEAALKAQKNNQPAPVIINTPPPTPVPAPVITPAPRKELEKLVTSRRQQNIYFANGSSQLNPAEQNKVREIANWLSTYELLDITIKGFASNVGSFEVNQRISQNRAANVKKALLNMGVESKRIILVPLGIDTTSADPANARRAEIHLLIRE